MSQFGFVGPSYEAANPMQDAQRLINWYCETDRTPGAKTVIGLLGCPGLVDTGASNLSGEVRGGWVLPGAARAVMVIGSTAVLVSFAAGIYSLTTIGTLGTATGPAVIRDNGVAGVVVIVDGQAIYAWKQSTNAFSVVPGLSADRVFFVDGWLVFNKPGTNQFFTSPLYWNGVDPFDATYFALADTSTGNLITMEVTKRELWFISEKHTEVWYDAGGQYFPFSRLQGATLDIGCAAKHSIARNSRGLIWLARNEFEGPSVAMTEGFDYHTISSPAVQLAISKYPVIDDAVGFVYKEEGHKFYVLNFPTADVTWSYDISTRMWHQRASFDAMTGLFHRARANCLINLGEKRIVGDHQNGKLWIQTREAFDDGGAPLVAVRRTPHVWDEKDRNRVTQTKLQIEFTAGVGLATGQGSDPQIMLRWSDDGARSWHGQRFVAIGKTGETKRRSIVRRLGSARDRVYEVEISDPVNRDVVGASLIDGANDS